MFNSALRLNGAIFHIEQQNLLTAFISLNSGGIVSYYNAGDSEVDGIEFDFLWTPMPSLNPGLVLSGAATYLDAKYTSFLNGNGYSDDTGLAYGPGTLTGLPGEDFSGNNIPRSPEWTATFGFNQSLLFGDHTFEIGADAYYNSGFFFSPQNSPFQTRDEYYLLNARISYFYEPWDLQLTLYGENITDQTYNEHMYVSDFGINPVLNDPKVFGGKVKWSF